MDIPGLCGNHNPPCLLQHASLEVEEAMFLQLRVFAKAKGVPITGELQSAYKHPRNSTRTMITDFDLLPRSRDPDGLPAAGGIKEEIHDGQRQRLVDEAQPDAYVQVGDALDPFTLLNVEGGELNLDLLLADGPAVLIFLRFAGCPACNIALPYYERQLYPRLRELGVPLVAVTL